MKRTLDRAASELASGMPTLRAVVVSAAPDGLIAWSWSRDGEDEIALTFARLDRAATACLESLGAARESRSLMLMAKDTWVVAWPLDEREHARLVVTVVLDGALQSGMVLLLGRRVLAALRAALDEADAAGRKALRDQLVELIVLADDPAAALERLAAAAQVELRRLGRLEELDEPAQARVRERLADQLRVARVANG